jgi:hypothetical protein
MLLADVTESWLNDVLAIDGLAASITATANKAIVRNFDIGISTCWNEHSKNPYEQGLDRVNF